MLIVTLLAVFLIMPAWAQSQDWEKEWNEILAAPSSL